MLCWFLLHNNQISHNFLCVCLCIYIYIPFLLSLPVLENQQMQCKKRLNKQPCIGLILLECSILRPSCHTMRKPKLEREGREARERQRYLDNLCNYILPTKSQMKKASQTFQPNRSGAQMNFSYQVWAKFQNHVWIYDCCCFKPLSFKVVSYIAIDN